MLQLEDQIDLIIPRGGEDLIRFVTGHSRIPVLKHYKGVCHIFIDESADPEMATRICLNAKVQKPAVCNAMETLLVHEKVAELFLREIARPSKRKGWKCAGAQNPAILPGIREATEDDWSREYLDLILSVKIVKESKKPWRISRLRILPHGGDPDVKSRKRRAFFQGGRFILCFGQCLDPVQ